MRTTAPCIIDKTMTVSGGGPPRGPSPATQWVNRARALFLLPLLLSGLLIPRLGLAAPEQPLGERTDLLLFWDERDLNVQTATRVEKPISRVAENITVVTAAEMEEMNAHSLAEVLNRVPGLFVAFQGQDFVSPSFLNIQGSEPRHVTVLLDGVVWNSLTEGSAETSSIPLGIIQRIEIIKGAASSTWGSALGGVVNIITKETGDGTIPSGVAGVSYGDANSRDYGVQLSGGAGRVGYFLHGGGQRTDGLRDRREYHRDDLYAKIDLSPWRDLDLLFTVGYSSPHFVGGDNPARQANSTTTASTLFATGAMDYRITRELRLHAGVYALRNRFDQPVNSLDTDQLLRGSSMKELTVAGDVKLTYSGKTHTAVVGADISHGALDLVTSYGLRYQAPPYNRPPRVLFSPSLDKWALFANDTLNLGKLAVTPGLRYDHDNISGSFVSPSIGVTRELAERTVVRASIARGFTSPPLGFTSTGGFFTIPNPSLTAERGWSYQVGVESGITDYLNAKVTLFRHDTRNSIVLDQSVRTAKIYRNGGSVTRQGYELQVETVPLFNVSLRAAHAYVHKDSGSSTDWTTNYSYLVGIRYDDRKSLMAQLSGYYIWWDSPAVNNARYHTFVWDLNLNKRLVTRAAVRVDAFLAVRNLFDAAYYQLASLPNAGRWVEGGLRFRF